MSGHNEAKAPWQKKAVYSIIEDEGKSKSYWLRLGTAVVNRDLSLTVFLNALPVNKRLHIRDLPEHGQEDDANGMRRRESRR